MGLFDTLLDVYVRQPALLKQQEQLQDRQLQEQMLSQSAMQGRMPQNVSIPNFDPSVLSTLSNISNTVAQRRQQMASQIDQMMQNKIIPPNVGALLKLSLNSNHPEIVGGALNSLLGYQGKIESANTMAGAEVQSANITGKSRERAAGIRAKGEEISAGIMGKSQETSAATRAKAEENVAATRAKTEENIARMNNAFKLQKAIENARNNLSRNFDNIVKFTANNANSAQLPSFLENHNQAAANAAVGLGGGVGFALENSAYNIPNVGLSYGLKNAIRDVIAKNLGGRIPPNLRKAYADAMATLDKDPGSALEKLYKSQLLDNESFQALLDQLRKNLEYFQNAQQAIQ